MSGHERVLLVDDDPSLLRVTQKHLMDAGYDVVAASNGRDALSHFEDDAPDLLVTDIEMDDLNGLQLLAEVKRRDPTAAVVVITAYGTIDRAVQAMKMGADDFLEKPFERERLLLTARRALQQRALVRTNVRLQMELEDRFSFENIIGGSAEMEVVFRMVARVAQSHAPVLVRGESGTGKELVARAIHFHGPRKDGPFVAVNCAAIPDTLLEAELFGHVRGAFTGASDSRRGRFQEANDGTIFLDEIGEMRPELQVKILRAVQEGEVTPVGADLPTPVDVRLVSATNRDLEAAMAEGQFRQDLYYRIAVVTIDLPPLRRRKDDIVLLARHALGKHGASAVKLSPEFLQKLREYEWPGNVRELQNVIERALVLRGQEDVLQAEDLPDHIRRPSPRTEALLVDIPDEGLSWSELERSLIERALEKAEGNQSLAARLLGLTRQTFLYRMEKHGLR